MKEDTLIKVNNTREYVKNSTLTDDSKELLYTLLDSAANSANGVNTIALTIRAGSYSLSLSPANVVYPNTPTISSTVDTELLFVRSYINAWRGYALP